MGALLLLDKGTDRCSRKGSGAGKDAMMGARVEWNNACYPASEGNRLCGDVARGRSLSRPRPLSHLSPR